MSIREYLKTAIIALRLNVLRSVLTTLGIIIGVASVIVMSAIGSGASKQIEDQINSLGTNQLTIFPGSANVGGRRGGFGSAPPLTEKDLRAVRDGVTGVMAVSGNLNTTPTSWWATPTGARRSRAWAPRSSRCANGPWPRAGTSTPAKPLRAPRWWCLAIRWPTNCSAPVIRSAPRCASTTRRSRCWACCRRRGRPAGATRTTWSWCPSPPRARGWWAGWVRPTRSVRCW